MSEIFEAKVRIRPDVGGFREEATRQLQGSLTGVTAQTRAFGRAADDSRRDIDRFGRGVVAANARALGFGRALTLASTAFLGGAGLGALIRTATDEFGQLTRVQATTQALLKSTGGAANVTAAGIQDLAKELEHLTGVDDEAVKSAENVLLAFRRVRNEVGEGNQIFNRATKAALDLSKVFGGDVTGTARILGRALADPARGVVLLRRNSIVFTQDQIRLIKSLVETGQALKAQKLVLDQVEQSVGGTAAAVGRTLPGQLDILRERAKDALGEYVKRLSESRDAAELASKGAKGLGDAFHIVETAAKTIGPPLVASAKAAADLTAAIGVGPILAGVVAFKAVGVAAGLAAKSQVAYARAVQVATGATAAETAAVTVSTGAFRAQAGAAALSSFRLSGSFAGLGNAGRVAATEIATVGRAGRVAGVGLGAGRVALAALGGPLGAAALGTAALAAGLLIMKRRLDNGVGSIVATRRALEGLSTALNEAQKSREAVAARSEDVSIARLNVQAAQVGVANARAAAARSTAARGSLEQRGLAEQLRQAEQRLADAERNLTRAQTQRRIAEERVARGERERPAVIDETTRALERQIAAARDLVRGESDLRGGALKRQQELVAAQIEKIGGNFQTLASSSKQAERVVGGALSVILSSLDRLPTEKEVNVIVRFAAAGGTDTRRVLEQLGIGRDDRVEARTRSAAAAGTAAQNRSLIEQFNAARAILKAEREKLTPLKEAVTRRREEAAAAHDALLNAQDAVESAREQQRAAREGVIAAREQAQAAREGLRDAREALVASQEALRDASAQARREVGQAVSDAKGNLDSLGQSVAQAFGRFADAGGTQLGRGGALGAQFRRLRAQVLAGGGGVDTQRAAQRIVARLQAQPQPNVDQLQQKFADLTDDLNRGKISLAEFNSRLTALIKPLDLRAFAAKFGTAAANALRDQITAARRQAGLVAGGPQRAGGGAPPALVRPLEAVAQGNREIKAAQDGVRDATREVARAQKDIARADQGIAKAQQDVLKSDRDAARAQRQRDAAALKVAREQKIELQAIRKATEQALRVKQAQARLEQKKPTGPDAVAAAALIGSGAVTP